MSLEVSGEFLYNYDKIRISKHKLLSIGSKLSEKQIYNRDHILSDFYSMLYIMNGDAIVYIDDKEYKVPQNSMIIADKFSYVLTYSAEENNTEDIIIDFKPELYGKCSGKDDNFASILKYVLENFSNEKLVLPAGYCLKDSDDGRLSYLFNHAMEEYKQRKLNYIDILRNDIHGILIEVARSLDYFNQTNKKTDVVQSIIDFIEIHYSEKISLASFAKVLNYSESYISKMFKKEIGMTLSEYLRQKRVYMACKMIQKENIKLNEIAIKVGFNDMAHFMKCFTNYVGMSPGQYRKSLNIAKDWFIGLGDLKEQKKIK